MRTLPPALRSLCASLALVSFSASVALAQATSPTVVSGRITDAVTGEPVAFAHVGIAERGIGTTSGYDGRFELKLPSGIRRDAAITVSSIGYETFRRPIRRLSPAAVVALSPSTTSLTEIVVMDEEAALNIIRRAVAAIPDNYPTEPTKTLAFYRESLTDDSLRYRYLAEGVLEVYKTSYKRTDEGQVGLVQARKVNLQDPLDTVVRSGFTSGHMAAHRFDFVKHREDFLNPDFFPVYRYRLEGMTTYNGSAVYVVAFEPDPEAETPKPKATRHIGNVVKILTGQFGAVDDEKVVARLAGRVFVTKDEHAFLRAEFEVTPEGQRRYSDYPLYSGGWRQNAYTVNYRESAGRWYFSDALREGEQPDGSMYVNEVKTTEILSDAEAVPYLERLQRNDAFVRVTGRYEPDFWRDYNVVPMREGLADGMRQYELMAAATAAFAPAFQDSLQRLRDSLLAVERERLAREAAAREARSAGADGEGEYGRGGQTETAGIDSPQPVASSNDFGFRAFLGFGAHRLPSGPLPLDIGYGLDGDGPELAVAGSLGERDILPYFRFDLDLRFRENLFARYSSGFDFTDDIFKYQALGVGAEVNLRPRHRPIVLRTVAQYSFLRHYRTVGEASHGGRRIDIGRKRFRGEDIRLGYGAHRHDVALTAELSVETKRGREVYLRGTYHYNLLNQPGVWFKETGQVFRKDHRLPLDDERLSVRSGGEPYSGAIVPEGTVSVTAGWVFK